MLCIKLRVRKTRRKGDLGTKVLGSKVGALRALGIQDYCVIDCRNGKERPSFGVMPRRDHGSGECGEHRSEEGDLLLGRRFWGLNAFCTDLLNLSRRLPRIF